MATVEAKISDFTVIEAEIIRKMEVSENRAESFNLDRKNNIRSTISRIKNELPGRDYKTVTTDAEILVWRLA